MQYYYPQQPQQPQQTAYPQQATYPQQPQQTAYPQQAAYPIQPVGYPQQQLAVPQQQPLPASMTQDEFEQQRKQYEAQQYKSNLRRTANSLGGLLLLFFGAELVMSIITVAVIYMSGLSMDVAETDALSLLESGVISSIVFFLVALIYCLIRRVSFARIFPFDKIGGAKLAKLCVIGISFSLMSNYVVDLLNNTFGLFGIENAGGNVDVGSNPSVIVYFLTVAVLPAFAEEFAFRGVIMGVLKPYSPALAIVISSAAFALMHGNFVQLPFTFCCGLVFAYMDIKTNSLLPSIIIHFLNNGLSVLADVLLSYGILSEFMTNALYGAIFVVTGILAFIFLKQMARNDKDFFRIKDGNDVISYKEKVKTTVTSPTMIAFTAVMLSYCVYYLTSLT